MIGTFLLDCIPACSVAEIAAEGLAADEGGEIGRIKGREVRLGRPIVFLVSFNSIRDVLAQTAMCAIPIFRFFQRKPHLLAA
ncbi:hypothetical protein [Mesorhizobium sp. M0306]|uniref:hypothetical protein n=1 Tax=unclassified Mesorhizobium TaxID=325217 RepID=UPI00333651E0